MSHAEVGAVDSAASVDEFSSDTVFSILGHSQRRAVLAALDRSPEPLALADVAAEVAWRNSDRPMAELPPEAVERTALSLHHRHVPELVEADALTRDEDQNTVTLTGKGKRLAAVQTEIGEAGIGGT